MPLNLFHGPIPGQSLTKPMGSSPVEKPPQYASLDDALDHVWQAITNPRQVVRLCLMLKKGVPAEYIARSLIFVGFSKGMWTPDVGLLMLKTVMRMIVSIAHLKKIKVTIFNPDKEQNDFLDKFMDLVEKPDEGNIAPTQTAPNGPQFTGVLGGNA